MKFKKKILEHFVHQLKNACLLFWQRTACYRKVTTAGELDNLLLPGFAEGKACGDTE